MLATLEPLRAAGISPAILAPPQGPLADKLAARGMELIPFPSSEAKRTQAQRREDLTHILRRRRPALLHANSLAMGRLSGPVAAELGIPSISHLRDIVKLSAQAASDLNCHARLLAVSNAVRAFHLSGGLDAAKTHVLHNGIDLEQFRPRPPNGYLHGELGLPAETALLATIGQIGLRKGQDVLLKAANLLADRLPRMHYLIIGERHSEKAESRKYEQDLHASAAWLAGRVHFLGRRDDIAELLNEVTLLVHPARQEPLGRVLLEAAAVGAAVVATRVGGTPEIFPPDGARLVPPDNAESLSEAILELAEDSSLRERLAAAARRHAEERFEIHTAVAGLLDHYQAVSP